MSATFRTNGKILMNSVKKQDRIPFLYIFQLMTVPVEDTT